jgi:hypothetical protein
VSLPGGRTRLALITLGTSTLVVSSTRAGFGAEGDALGQRLALRGDGPYAIVLRADGPEERPAPDLALTHGASIEFDTLLSPAQRPERTSR